MGFRIGSKHRIKRLNIDMVGFDRREKNGVHREMSRSPYRGFRCREYRGSRGDGLGNAELPAILLRTVGRELFMLAVERGVNGLRHHCGIKLLAEELLNLLSSLRRLIHCFGIVDFQGWNSMEF